MSSDEPTGTLVGRITYRQSVDEIFDLVVLPDKRRPGIVGLDRDERALGVTTPNKTYWVVPRKHEAPDARQAPGGGTPADDATPR